jgi:hypothetical protein
MPQSGSSHASPHCRPATPRRRHALLSRRHQVAFGPTRARSGRDWHRMQQILCGGELAAVAGVPERPRKRIAVQRAQAARWIAGCDGRSPCRALRPGMPEQRRHFRRFRCAALQVRPRARSLTPPAFTAARISRALCAGVSAIRLVRRRPRVETSLARSPFRSAGQYQYRY